MIRIGRDRVMYKTQPLPLGIDRLPRERRRNLQRNRIERSSALVLHRHDGARMHRRIARLQPHVEPILREQNRAPRGIRHLELRLRCRRPRFIFRRHLRCVLPAFRKDAPLLRLPANRRHHRQQQAKTSP